MFKFSRNILKEKGFIILWIGQSISKLGNSIFQIACMWYVLQKTGSSTKMGITLLYSTLPAVLLSPVAGAAADRYKRKMLIIASDTVQGIILIVLSLLIYVSNPEVYVIYIASALMSAVGTFFTPAFSAAIPTIVSGDNLCDANTLSKFSSEMSNIFGPIIGGAMAAFIGIYGLVLLDAISFIIAALMESRIRIPEGHIVKNSVSNFKEDIKIGLEYTFKNKILIHFTIVGGFIINFFLAPLSIIIPIFSQRVLNSGSRGYGILESSIAIGSLAMVFIIPCMSKKMSYFKMTFLGLTFEGITLIAFSMSKSLQISAIIMGLLGASVCICSVSLSTVFQKIIPNNLMGRVSSIMTIVSQSTVPIGMFIGGICLDRFKVVPVLLVSGIIVSLAGFSTIGYTRERKIKGKFIFQNNQ